MQPCAPHRSGHSHALIRVTESAQDCYTCALLCNWLLAETDTVTKVQEVQLKRIASDTKTEYEAVYH